MAEGIVRITPKGGKSGTIEITGTDTSKVKTASQLTYIQSGYKEGDRVTCTIDSSSSCTVTGLKKGE